MVDLAEKVKKVVKIPVIAIGRLQYPELAERVMLEGKADFIALGRALLADPEWANKVKEGRGEDICPCIDDQEGCRRRIHEGKYISCTVNPACGMEKDLAISRAEKKKRVLVIGGGPGGMEAAIVAALRGHAVILCEKNHALGGNLIPASAPDFKNDYKTLINYLSTQVKKHGVEIRLATEVTTELVSRMKPDVVFIATGAIPIIPEIPGIDNGKVATAIDVLLGRKQAGKSVVIIGGGTVGCETALHLAHNGKEVTIVEILESLAEDMYAVNRMHLLKLIVDASVKTLTATRVLEITNEGIAIADKKNRKSTLEADTIILACGFKPNETLLKALSGKVSEVYTIGDCVEPRKIMDAIKEGFPLARLI